MQATRNALFVALFIFPFVMFGKEVDKKVVKQIDKELACNCGCSLTVADCRVSMTCTESKGLQDEVVQFLESGLTPKEVLGKMREKYGEQILAAPTKEGFNLTAWTLPFVALLLGGVFAAYYIRRWKSDEEKQPGPATGRQQAKENAQEAPSSYEKRIEDELKEFD